jgi:AmmeMemoRadiSam system protein B
MSTTRIGPVVAGSWYPSAPDTLRSQLDDYLLPDEDAEITTSPDAGRVIALIAPHAGYVYSGAVAGKVFCLLRGARFTRVILIGPSHHAAFRGAALPQAERYVTPLGEVNLDSGAIGRLKGRAGIEITDRPFLPEHCLEMELPFLQHALAPGWRLLPILIGAGSSAQDCQHVVDAVLPLVDRESLLVVSSDFTHYGPRFGYTPFRDAVPQKLRELDMGAVEKILAGDRSGFQRYVERTGATICGRRAIDVLLGLLPSDSRPALVDYDTSGNITGDWANSVSYASLLFRSPAG